MAKSWMQAVGRSAVALATFGIPDASEAQPPLKPNSTSVQSEERTYLLDMMDKIHAADKKAPELLGMKELVPGIAREDVVDDVIKTDEIRRRDYFRKFNVHPADIRSLRITVLEGRKKIRYDFCTDDHGMDVSTSTLVTPMYDKGEKGRYAGECFVTRHADGQTYAKNYRQSHAAATHGFYDNRRIDNKNLKMMAMACISGHRDYPEEERILVTDTHYELGKATMTQSLATATRELSADVARPAFGR